jgi:hypothetical protein
MRRPTKMRFGRRHTRAKRDIRFTLGEVEATIGGHHLQQDRGMRLAEGAQRRQQHFAGEKVIGGDADRTGQTSPQCGSLTGEGACRDLDRGRRLSEFLSHLAQRVTRLPAVEKLEAQGRLQRIDTAGTRALAHAKFASGRQCGACLRDGKEMVQVIPVEHDPFCNFAEWGRNLGV